MHGATNRLVQIENIFVVLIVAVSVFACIFITVIGGIGTLPGPIIGVVVFYALQRALADYGTIYLIVLGCLGITVMLFARRGLWGLFTDRTGIDPLPLRHRPPRAAKPSHSA